MHLIMVNHDHGESIKQESERNYTTNCFANVVNGFTASISHQLLLFFELFNDHRYALKKITVTIIIHKHRILFMRMKTSKSKRIPQKQVYTPKWAKQLYTSLISKIASQKIPKSRKCLTAPRLNFSLNLFQNVI